MMCTGLRLPDIRADLDIPTLRAMNAYWKKHPPLNLMVQAYLGIESTDSKPNNKDQPNLIQVLQNFPQGHA